MADTLAEKKKKVDTELRQLQNRQKILMNRSRIEERRARTRRLIEHGAILEGVFPAVTDMEGETIKTFLIALSHLPGAAELTEKMHVTGDAG